MLFVKLSILALGLGLISAQEVTLEQGAASGMVKNTNMGPVTEFLGLPYAKAPVGNLRFLPPTAHQGWGSNVYDATNFGANCIQKKEMLMNFDGIDQSAIDGMQFNEDCLFLNVFAPGNAIDEMAKLPVMVWIHGGHFNYGSGQIVGTTSKESPEALVIKGNVIVVTINYRLNAFGFLTLGSEMVPGNNGLIDQTMAMEWVKMNIHKFGGDPMSITIFGDEAGGLSVSLHLFNEYAYGLFKRAAISSGAYTGWGVPMAKDAAWVWWYYADSLGCKSMHYNTTETGMCLQGKTTDELLDKLPMKYPTFVVDGHLLKDQPAHLLKKGSFNPVQLIVGCNSEDGDFLLLGKLKPMADEIYANGMPKDELEMFMDLLHFLGYPKGNTEMGRNIQMLIGATYFSNFMDQQQILQDLMTLARDAFFYAPALKLAYYNMEAGKPSYVYFFEHSSPLNMMRHQSSPLTLGAGLGTEVWYIMGDTNMDTNGATQPIDKDLANSMMNAWSSFAKNGMPQFIDENNQMVDWPKFDKWMTRLSFLPPLSQTDDITNSVPKGPLYFNKLFPSALKAMYLEEEMKKNPQCMMSNGMDSKPEPGMKPKPEDGDMEKSDWMEMPDEDDMEKSHGEKPEGEHKPGMEGKPEWDMYPEPESKMQKMEITTYIMLAFICLLVLLMIITFGIMCSLYGHIKRGGGSPPQSKF